jgi:glycosyltransferase involved in cell wall biosynthesis
MRVRSGMSVVVIPVHNEASTIGAIVAESRAYLPVIVVDDASDDGSGQRAAASGATVLTQPRQRGKGAALQRGFAEAMRCGADTIVTLDGDGQHSPQDIPRLVAASQRWPGSIIIGGRLEAEAQIPRYRLQAMLVGSFWINWMGRCHIRDTQSGFRVYPAGVLQVLSLKHGGFLLESEILIKAGQAGYPVREIPIRAVYPPTQRSQYRPAWDGTVAALYLLYRGVRFWPTQIRWLFPERRTHAGEMPGQEWHRALVVALATGLLPMLFLTMLCQLFLRRLGPDVLTPVIRRFYDQRLLHNSAVDRKTLHESEPHKQWEFI